MEFETWLNDGGRSPVQDFLDTLPSKQQARVIARFDYYEQLNPTSMGRLGFTEGVVKGLMELRLLLPVPIRMLYAFRFEKNFLLHAFHKKYDGPIKRREIQTALKRLEHFDTSKNNQKINLF